MTREEAFQEFWYNVVHPSFKPNISEEAKAVAMVALEEPESVHGYWIRYPDCGVTRCSECNWSKDTNWCPAYDTPMKRTSLRIKFCNCGEK